MYVLNKPFILLRVMTYSDELLLLAAITKAVGTGVCFNLDTLHLAIRAQNLVLEL